MAVNLIPFARRWGLAGEERAKERGTHTEDTVTGRAGFSGCGSGGGRAGQMERACRKLANDRKKGPLGYHVRPGAAQARGAGEGEGCLTR